MRFAPSAFWFSVPVCLGSVALLLGANACSSSDPGTVAATTDGGTEAAKTTDGGGGETSTTSEAGSCALKQPVDKKASCNSCAETNCCDEANACTDEKDCQAFIQCAADCLSDAGVQPDGGGADAGSAKACATACQKAHKTGVAVYVPLVQCIQGSCKSDCL